MSLIIVRNFKTSVLSPFFEKFRILDFLSCTVHVSHRHSQKCVKNSEIQIKYFDKVKIKFH